MEESRYTTREEVEALLAETLRYAKAGPITKRRLNRRGKPRSPAKKLLHAVSTALYYALIIVLCAALFVGVRAKLKDEVPTVLGYHIFTLETGSMIPTLPIGSYIIVKQAADPAAIPEGTITTFRFEDGTIVTHRVIEVLQTEDGVRYRTKGDNPENDPDAELLSPERVIGTLQLIIRLPEIW